MGTFKICAEAEIVDSAILLNTSSLSGELNLLNKVILAAISENSSKIKKGAFKAKYSVPYWNDECKKAIREKLKCFKYMHKYPQLTLINCRYAKSHAKYVIKQAKNSFWENH